MKLARLAVLLTLSFLSSSNCLGQTLAIAITGKVSSGIDTSGVFGQAGGNLAGRPFTLVFSFDNPAGDKQPPKCTGAPPYSPQICTSQSPGKSHGTATLQIGDSVPFQFGVSTENVTSAATLTTWIAPISSYRMTLGVGDGRTMVAGSIGSTTPKPVPSVLTGQTPPANAAWDYPLSDTAATSAPGISFTIDKPGATAYGMLDGTTICVGESCATPLVRVFFSISYLNEEKKSKPGSSHQPGPFQSFPDAAATWEREIKQKYAFKEGQDLFIRAFVRSAESFADTWQNIAVTSSGKNRIVVEGALFTHATYPFLHELFPLLYPEMVTGLEFQGLPDKAHPAGTASTLTEPMIRELPKLHWDTAQGQLHLFGCNTAVPRGNPEWIPADVFAKTQGVHTWGERWFSDFSQSPTKYVTIINANPANFYLGAYWAGPKVAAQFIFPGALADPEIMNVSLGSRIPPHEFLPQ